MITAKQAFEISGNSRDKFEFLKTHTDVAIMRAAKKGDFDCIIQVNDEEHEIIEKLIHFLRNKPYDFIVTPRYQNTSDKKPKSLRIRWDGSIKRDTN